MGLFRVDSVSTDPLIQWDSGSFRSLSNLAHNCKPTTDILLRLYSSACNTVHPFDLHSSWDWPWLCLSCAFSLFLAVDHVIHPQLRLGTGVSLATAAAKMPTLLAQRVSPIWECKHWTAVIISHALWQLPGRSARPQPTAPASPSTHPFIPATWHCSLAVASPTPSTIVIGSCGSVVSHQPLHRRHHLHHPHHFPPNA